MRLQLANKWVALWACTDIMKLRVTKLWVRTNELFSTVNLVGGLELTGFFTESFCLWLVAC